MSEINRQEYNESSSRIHARIDKIVKKDIDAIRHELKILRRKAEEYHSGTLISITINIERELDKIEKALQKVINHARPN